MITTFTCEACHETFRSEWTEEERRAEYKANFGEYATEDKGGVCTACYERFWEWAKVNAPELKRLV